MVSAILVILVTGMYAPAHPLPQLRSEETLSEIRLDQVIAISSLGFELESMPTSMAIAENRIHFRARTVTVTRRKDRHHVARRRPVT
jgi:hypothetical protein